MPGRLFDFIQRYWTIAAAIIVTFLGLLELIFSASDDGLGLELYFTLWAGVSGGIWFLFETAEEAMAADKKASIVAWLQSGQRNRDFAAIPKQFSRIFDSVFGDEPRDERFFIHSYGASMLGVLVLTFLRYWSLLVISGSDLMR